MGKRFCGQCGAPNDESAKFCINCGAPLGEWQETRSAEPDRVIYTSIAPRSIALSIVLSIITFGIYGLYWIYKLNNEVNELAEDPIAPGGGMVIFLMIVTFGIYGLYWLYKMGQKCDYIRQVNGSSGILYLILGIFGLGIVADALIQDTINKVLE